MKSTSHSIPNRLLHAASPYLRQHAYNPVDWYPWAQEAFNKAISEDKPVLVSIGYFACPWCHVMERESFENAAVAAFMNEHFVCIKVDREEHPAVDHLYMGACQMLTNAGGWPLNMFLTPQLKAFTGGTYFPTEPRYGKASWMDVLTFVKDVWTNRREEAEQQAATLTESAAGSERKLLVPAATGTLASIDATEIRNRIMEAADTVHGGFGAAPKFPAAMTLTYLLRYNYRAADGEVAEHISKSLDHMMAGGIYDHVGGGFSRYTVDAGWMVPHFEKMLYDNALLMALYAEAYRSTGNPQYRFVAEHTAAFIIAEMTHEQGGFFAAYDADSEGVEGKYYTWDKSEIEAVLHDKADAFCQLFDVRAKGNWEHTNILHLNHSAGVLEKRTDSEVTEALAKLKEVRSERIKPLLDDKVNVAWNAWMGAAFCELYKATAQARYLEVAERNTRFILDHCRQEDGIGLMHIWHDGQAYFAATIDDYAALIRVLLSLFQLTGKYLYLAAAEELEAYVAVHFYDVNSGMFFQTAEKDNDLPVRTMELFDHATPSGNAIMAENYHLLQVLTSKDQYEQVYRKMITAIQTSLHKFPTSLGRWLCAAIPLQIPTAEVVITGPEINRVLEDLHTIYYPMMITLPFCDNSSKKLPLLTDRNNEKVTRIYLCKNQTCTLPVSTVSEFRDQLLHF